MIQRGATRIRIWPAYSQGVLHREKLARQISNGLRHDRLKTQTEMFRQSRGGASRADGNQDRIAVEYARKREIAKVRPVGDIDQDSAPLQPQRRGLCGSSILDSDESELCVVRLGLGADHSTCALHQPRLRIGHCSGPDDHNRLSIDAVE